MISEMGREEEDDCHFIFYEYTESANSRVTVKHYCLSVICSSTFDPPCIAMYMYNYI